MNNKYFADKIIELDNKNLEVNEYRERLIRVIEEIRADERAKFLAEGIKPYKQANVENTVREMPQRNFEMERQKPIIESLTNEGRFTDEQKIEEL